MVTDTASDNAASVPMRSVVNVSTMEGVQALSLSLWITMSTQTDILNMFTSLYSAFRSGTNMLVGMQHQRLLLLVQGNADNSIMQELFVLARVA